MIWHRVGEEWRSSGPRGTFVIAIIGENASAKPILWELRGPDGLKRACDSVNEAKTAVAVIVALQQEHAHLRMELKRLRADCRCGNFSVEAILSAIDPASRLERTKARIKARRSR